MAIEDSAPCRHPGASPEAVVERVRAAIEGLTLDTAFLASKGLTPTEYALALPAAIENLRGSRAASTADRRTSMIAFLKEMQKRGGVAHFQIPAHGEDTVYRLSTPAAGSVAIIQKGCPDGAHSSLNWSRPSWADEAYLWWMCSSTAYDPGVHVWKGVNRLKQRFFSDETADFLDGVIFHNELCGSPDRPCPKSATSITIEGRQVPPPCVYLLPRRERGTDAWNWDGRREARFPVALYAMFGVEAHVSQFYTGYVGFQRRGQELRTSVVSHFGPGRSVSNRS